MPINRIPKLRGTGLPGAFDPAMLTSIVDGNIPAWNAVTQRWEVGGSITFTDNQELRFGAGNDLQIYSDGASGNIDSTGALILAPSLDGGIILRTQIKMLERAAADNDSAGYGQIWVKTATPNELWFTDDAGTDHQLAFVV